MPTVLLNSVGCGLGKTAHPADAAVLDDGRGVAGWGEGWKWAQRWCHSVNSQSAICKYNQQRPNEILKRGSSIQTMCTGRSVRRQQHDDQPHACTHVLHSRSPTVAFPRAAPHRSVCCNQPRCKAKHPPHHKLCDAHGCLVHVANSEASRDGRKQRINAWSNAMASLVTCKHQRGTLQPSRADADETEARMHFAYPKGAVLRADTLAKDWISVAGGRRILACV